jgi:SAM-dependent methyltransferase
MVSGETTGDPSTELAAGRVVLPAARSSLLRCLGGVHAAMVFQRRVSRLASAIVPLIPPGSRILDIGCGDGSLAALVAEECPGASLEGLELVPRPRARIRVNAFDGRTVPLPDGSVDIVLLVDVLHHTEDPLVLLREAARVTRRALIIKDHRMGRMGATGTLRFMDWVGNRPHDVVLPYQYWAEDRWRAAWDELGLTVEHYQTELGLYPWPARWLFETGLHFLAKLSRTRLSESSQAEI